MENWAARLTGRLWPVSDLQVWTRAVWSSKVAVRPWAACRVTPKQTSQEQGFGVPGRRRTDTTPHW